MLGEWCVFRCLSHCASRTCSPPTTASQTHSNMLSLALAPSPSPMRQPTLCSLMHRSFSKKIKQMRYEAAQLPSLPSHHSLQPKPARPFENTISHACHLMLLPCLTNIFQLYSREASTSAHETSNIISALPGRNKYCFYLP